MHHRHVRSTYQSDPIVLDWGEPVGGAVCAVLEDHVPLDALLSHALHGLRDGVEDSDQVGEEEGADSEGEEEAREGEWADNVEGEVKEDKGEGDED